MPGGPKACWCMVWRATPIEAQPTDGLTRKAAMKARITAGTTVGLLSHLNKEPVARCSVAPRSTYRRLVEHGGDDEGVCFAVGARNDRSPGRAPSLWLGDGFLNRECSIHIPLFASPPVIRDRI